MSRDYTDEVLNIKFTGWIGVYYPDNEYGNNVPKYFI